MTITLNNGSIDVPFEPIVTRDPLMRSFVEDSSSPMVHRQRLGFEFRPSAQQNEGNKVTIRFNVPVPAVTTEAGTNGYISVPKALGENKVVLNYVVNKYTTPTQAGEVYEELVSLLALPSVKAILVDQMMNIAD